MRIGSELRAVAIAGVTAAAAWLAAIAAPAWGQYRVGPVYPESPEPAVVRNSGYDPFVFNPHTGRFDYVPIPYDPEPPPGRGYSPFRFNWHSGGWDYVPVPLELDRERWDAEGRRRAAQDLGGSASNYVDTRLESPGELSLEAAPAAAKEGPSEATPPSQPAVRPGTVFHRPAGDVPATRPATRPTTAPGPRQPTPPDIGEPVGDGWVRTKGIVGRWEFDYLNGRWVFVLPGD